MALSTHSLRLAEAAGHPMADHSRAVAERASKLAEELGLRPDERQEIEMAALLKDIGRVALMEEIPYSADGLTSDDMERVRNHPVRAEAMLLRAGPEFRSIAGLVRSCSERWDGTGHPDGLAGERIPLGARVIHCAAAFEALTGADGRHGGAMTAARAVRELWRRGGSQFDPGVVAALTRTAAIDRADARDISEAAPEAVDELRQGLGGSAAQPR